MCGIAGILHFDHDRTVDEKLLLSMRDTIRHRGPDGAGHYINGPIGLAHRRLSIQDLSENGRQPFASPDGRYQIIFNGEVYNFKELRPALEAKGFTFRSETDTEVLLYLYMSEGEKMLEKLNGMFAFAVWDNEERSLFIARDRLGVKPFYYSTHDNTFYFASEQKAILNAGVPKTLDEELFEELLLFRFVAGPQTLLRHIGRLLPGHCGWVRNGQVQLKRWWNLSEKIREKRSVAISDHRQWFEDTFNSSVNYRTISDVSVGVMLSGGLDSSSVAAALSMQGHQSMSSFTVGFEEAAYNEGNLAKQVADKFGFRYHELRVKGEQLYSELFQAAWLHDEPLIHQNDPQMLALSRYAKSDVTVLLSGEAADELMGGYVRYKALRYPQLRTPLKFTTSIARHLSSNKRIEKLNRYYSLDQEEQVLFNSCNLYPADMKKAGLRYSGIEKFSFRRKMLAEAKQVFPDDASRQAMYLDQHSFLNSLLDRNDRMTMGASIECRVPFLDYRLVETVSSFSSSELLKGKKGKHILFNTMGRYLPDDVRNFKKWGFGVPWAKYLRTEPVFIQTMEEMKSCTFFKEGIFADLPITQMIDRFQAGHGEDEILLRQLMMIYMWYKAYYTQIG